MSGRVKKTAVITDATSAEFFFPLWHRYYGGQFGSANLHVVTYEGLKPLFAGFELGNVWEINAKYDDMLRAGVISDLVGILLRSYDVVLRCDVDEFLVPDRTHGHQLKDFVEHNEQPYVTACGIDVVELADDSPLDLSKPVFGGQRCYGIRSAALNKTALITMPVRWAAGFHGASVPPRFGGLYNLHLKFADLKSRIAWHEQMLSGIEPGTKAYEYFAVGADHLIAVQKFFAALPRNGQESQDEFDARYMASVSRNDRNGIFQGEFIRQDFLIPLDAFAHAQGVGNGGRAEFLPVSTEERLLIFEHLARAQPLREPPRRILAFGPDAPCDALSVSLPGFQRIDLEKLAEDIVPGLFAGAEMVVALGKYAVRELRYCAPGTSVIVVLPPNEGDVGPYLSSLDLRFRRLEGNSTEHGWVVRPDQMTEAVADLVPSL